MSVSELHSRLPAPKVNAVLAYLNEHNCSIKVVGNRKSKKGDFRSDGNKHRITINDFDNKFRFLLTLIHEIAHLKTFVEYGTKVKPHGSEWKTNFRFVFALFDFEEEFGANEELLTAILQESNNANACAGVDYALEKILAQFDHKPQSLLADLPVGAQFKFREKHYVKLENKRTRALCLNAVNQRKYTISLAAGVDEC